MLPNLHVWSTSSIAVLPDGAESADSLPDTTYLPVCESMNANDRMEASRNAFSEEDMCSLRGDGTDLFVLINEKRRCGKGSRPHRFHANLLFTASISRTDHLFNTIQESVQRQRHPFTLSEMTRVKDDRPFKVQSSDTDGPSGHGKALCSSPNSRNGQCLASFICPPGISAPFPIIVAKI